MKCFTHAYASMFFFCASCTSFKLLTTRRRLWPPFYLFGRSVDDCYQHVGLVRLVAFQRNSSNVCTDFVRFSCFVFLLFTPGVGLRASYPYVPIKDDEMNGEMVAEKTKQNCVFSTRYRLIVQYVKS